MKAILSRRYGPPSEYRLEDVPTPMPRDEEVRVRVVAAAVNPADWHVQRADPFLVRFSFGLFRPKHRIPGADLAGVVEAVGPRAGPWQVGDPVFVDLSLAGLGAFAEQVVVAATHLARIPEGVSFEAAATLGVAGQTALQGLRDHAKVARGQRVLVNGASGGVGTFAVQIAKHLGAHVTGVASGPNEALVRGLGADAFVDYTRQDPTQTGDRYHVVLDAAAYRDPRDYAACLEPGGAYVLVGGSTWSFLKLALRGSAWGRRRGVRFQSFLQRNRVEDLSELARLVAEGMIRPVIDRTYALSEAGEALAYVETRRARGKVVLRVGDPPSAPQGPGTPAGPTRGNGSKRSPTP